MMNEYTLCPKCGGVKSLKQPEHNMRVSTSVFRACSCPSESAPKHDGWLGPKAEGLAPFVSHNTDPWIQKPVVRIEHANRPSMDLAPHQALSLLAWLLQEKPELERLSKEQG